MRGSKRLLVHRVYEPVDGFSPIFFIISFSGSKGSEIESEASGSGIRLRSETGDRAEVDTRSK